MTKTTIFRLECDRCQAISPARKGWSEVEARQFVADDRFEIPFKGDLCPKCTGELLAWWKKRP